MGSLRRAVCFLEPWGRVFIKAFRCLVPEANLESAACRVPSPVPRPFKYPLLQCPGCPANDLAEVLERLLSHLKRLHFLVLRDVGEGFGMLPHGLVKAAVAVHHKPTWARQLTMLLRQLLGRVGVLADCPALLAAVHLRQLLGQCDVLAECPTLVVLRDVGEGFGVLAAMAS